MLRLDQLVHLLCARRNVVIDQNVIIASYPFRLGHRSF